MQTPKKRQSRSAERRAMRPATVDPNQFYSIAETAAALDKSVAGLYNDIAAGKLTTVTDGTRRKVHGAEIIRVSTALAAQAQPPEAA
jgi:hypothetical protein